MKTGRISRIWKALAAAMMLAMMIGVSAMAADKVVEMVPDASGAYVYSGVNEDSLNTVYHKFTAPSSGVIGVSGCSISAYSGTTFGLRVALCDSSFRVLDSNGYAYISNTEDVELYAVKKGVYYIRVSGEENYAVAAAFQKWTNKGGTSKSKAKTIKQNKTTKGLMPAGEKSSAADWYKFKVTKSKKLNIIAATEGTGSLQFYVYGPSYKKGALLGTLRNQKGSYYSINALNRKKIKIKTGTYYIKVVRPKYDKKSNAAYTLKWKLK